MSNGRKTLFIISFLIIDLLLVSGILLIRDMTGKNILNKEMMNLTKLDISKDSFDTEIKSKGEYAVVEKAIKKYLDDYSTEIQTILNTRYDDKLNNLLDIDNYKDDGPLFEESIEYVELVRNNFNYNVDILKERVNDDAINNHIYNYDVDGNDVQLYNNLLVSYCILDKIEESQNSLDSESIKINNYIDSIYNTLCYLRDNSSSYSIVDDELVFYDDIVRENYLDLFNKTKRIFD